MGKKPRILFVDDEKNVLEAYNRSLHDKSDKWDLSFLDSSREALNTIGENNYDVLVVDILMPELSGLDLITQLKKKYGSLPQILVVSGFGETKLRVKAYQLGVLDFLSKPVDHIELVTRIENAIKINRYQKELIEKNNALERELSNSQRMELMGYVAAGAVHDLKNILSSMNILSELIQMEASENVEINKLLEKLFSGIFHADDLVKQLLIFKRVDDTASTEKVDIIKTIEKCIDISFPNNMIRGNVTFNHVHDHLEVEINRVHAFQLFTNLFINAKEAIGSKGKIVIKVSSEIVKKASKKYCKIAISDDGIGMDEITLQHLFEPHFSNKSEESNFGLGMYVVNWIIKKYNGEISVSSEKDIGTTFELLLPV